MALEQLDDLDEERLRIGAAPPMGEVARQVGGRLIGLGGTLQPLEAGIELLAVGDGCRHVPARARLEAERLEGGDGPTRHGRSCGGSRHDEARFGLAEAAKR